MTSDIFFYTSLILWNLLTPSAFAAPTHNIELLRGQTLRFEEGEEFVVRDRLGSGNMGTVYQVRRASNGEKLALKLIQSPLSDGELRYLRSFKLVEEKLASIPDAAEIPLERISFAGSYTVQRGALSGYSYAGYIAQVRDAHFSLDRINGAFYVREDDSSEIQARKITALHALMVQIIDALAYLSTLDIALNDIKPSNIYVANRGNHSKEAIDVDAITNGQARIVFFDYDLAAPLGDPHFGGSDGYIAPERYRPAYRTDGLLAGEIGDLFSAAATLFRLLHWTDAFSEICRRNRSTGDIWGTYSSLSSYLDENFLVYRAILKGHDAAIRHKFEDIVTFINGALNLDPSSRAADLNQEMPHLIKINTTPPYIESVLSSNREKLCQKNFTNEIH